MDIFLSSKALVGSLSEFVIPTFFFTKLGIVVYYHEAVCLAEKLIHYLQCQGHSGDLRDQNMTIFDILSELLVRLQPNLV